MCTSQSSTDQSTHSENNSSTKLILFMRALHFANKDGHKFAEHVPISNTLFHAPSSIIQQQMSLIIAQLLCSDFHLSLCSAAVRQISTNQK